MTFEQKSLTRDEALTIMTEVVEEYGADHVYQRPDGESCLNWYRGCPSCLIGHVLHRWGLPDAFLAEFTDTTAYQIISRIDANYSRVVIEAGVAAILMEAQRVQDDGDTWGDALAAARAFRDAL